MKQKNIGIILTLLLIFNNIKAQSNEDILNILIHKNLISQSEADSIRKEAAQAKNINKDSSRTFHVVAGKYLNVSGYTHIRYQSFQESGKSDFADIRRARLDARGVIATEWEYRFQMVIAGNAKLLDAYATFKPYEFFKIQVGQFKIPFSYESILASPSMETIDRSQVVEALVARGKDVLGNFNGRDVGVQAFGNLWKVNNRYIIEYFLGGFNGNGTNIADNNESKDLAARLVLHPMKGLNIGASWYDGYDKYGTTVPENHIRTRIGGELRYIYKFVSLHIEYIEGNDSDIKRKGYYVQAASYIYKRKIQLVARYDYYDPDKSKKNDASMHYLSGINYYFNDLTRLQVNVSNREEETNNFNNDLINVQLQIGF